MEEKENINEDIANPIANLKPLKGFEIIAESMVYMVYDIFGRNTCLSILYQMGAGPGHQIAKRIKEKYQKQEFDIVESLKILLKELTDFYSIKVKEIQESENQLRIIIENHCFLREPMKHREKLKFGKAFCRVNKGYFESAFKDLLGDKIKNIEINYLENDPEKDVCIEELVFYL
ncbi:MAG: hypothetical protein BAJALOKI1v1_660003 [Promethearchaeota archaeon]|nr:MAG: hypothetical protein BAJALOKI1v1_660003 [Candidatus Lokiarchaeota archaeon]